MWKACLLIVVGYRPKCPSETLIDYMTDEGTDKPLPPISLSSSLPLIFFPHSNPLPLPLSSPYPPPHTHTFILLSPLFLSSFISPPFSPYSLFLPPFSLTFLFLQTFTSILLSSMNKSFLPPPYSLSLPFPPSFPLSKLLADISMGRTQTLLLLVMNSLAMQSTTAANYILKGGWN